MIKFFSTGFFSRYLWLILLLIVCWLPGFVHPDNYLASPDAHFTPFQSILKLFPLAGMLINFIIYLFSIFLLNAISIEHNISGKINTLPIFAYLLFTASIKAYFSANPYLLISLLLLVMIRYLFGLHQRESSYKNAFDAGFYLGMASLLYPPLVYLILLIWLSIMLHRVNSLRAYATSLIGLLSPFVFLFTWFYLNNQFQSGLTGLVSDILPTLVFKIELPIHEIVAVCLLIIIGIVFSFKTLSTLGEKSINLRRNLAVLVLFFYLQLALLIAFNQNIQAYMLPAIPFAFIVSHQLVLIRKPKRMNILLMIITLFIILNHLSALIYVD